MKSINVKTLNGEIVAFTIPNNITVFQFINKYLLQNPVTSSYCNSTLYYNNELFDTNFRSIPDGAQLVLVSGTNYVALDESYFLKSRNYAVTAKQLVELQKAIDFANRFQGRMLDYFGDDTNDVKDLVETLKSIYHYATCPVLQQEEEEEEENSITKPQLYLHKDKVKRDLDSWQYYLLNHKYVVVSKELCWGFYDFNLGTRHYTDRKRYVVLVSTLEPRSSLFRVFSLDANRFIQEFICSFNPSDVAVTQMRSGFALFILNHEGIRYYPIVVQKGQLVDTPPRRVEIPMLHALPKENGVSLNQVMVDGASQHIYVNMNTSYVSDGFQYAARKPLCYVARLTFDMQQSTGPRVTHSQQFILSDFNICTLLSVNAQGFMVFGTENNFIAEYLAYDDNQPFQRVSFENMNLWRDKAIIRQAEVKDGTLYTLSEHNRKLRVKTLSNHQEVEIHIPDKVIRSFLLVRNTMNLFYTDRNAECIEILPTDDETLSIKEAIRESRSTSQKGRRRLAPYDSDMESTRSARRQRLE